MTIPLCKKHCIHFYNCYTNNIGYLTKKCQRKLDKEVTRLSILMGNEKDILPTIYPDRI